MSTKEINILLLGLTGAGKSTTINALANYFRFSTFEEALHYSTCSSKNIVEVIPTQFTLPHPETGKKFVIKSSSSKFSDDGNERQNLNDFGQSATLFPTGYLFTYGRNSVLRVIDTPGIGDTEGIFDDVKNYENIRAYLHCFKKLHGVIIIVNGNENRKTTFLKYCIAEIFTHFHRSVAQNIVFCFTFSYTASGLYGPKMGYNTIKSLIENDIKLDKMKLELEKNAFFIENDAYRFLLAKKQGYPWNKLSENFHRESWNHSVKEFEKMFKRILSFSAHDLVDTISLINAKNINFKISESVDYLTQRITQQSVDLENLETKFEKSLKVSSSFKPSPKNILFLIKDNFADLYNNHTLKLKIAEMKQEKEKIENISLQFVFFIKFFSMLPSNLYFNDYTKILLVQENRKYYSNSEKLKNLKKHFDESATRLNEKLNYKLPFKYNLPIIELYAHSAAHMFHWQKELSNLQNTGHIFKNVIKVKSEKLHYFKIRESTVLNLLNNENLLSKLFKNF